MRNAIWAFGILVGMATFSEQCFGTAPTPPLSPSPRGFILAMVDLASVDGYGPLPSDLGDKGILLVMNRATIGVGNPDPVFAPHTLQAWAAGLATGAYHVPFPTHSADAQAEEFVSAVKKVCKPGAAMLLAVDWEEVCVKRQGKNGKCLIKKAAPPDQIQSLVSAIKSRTNNARVLIYTRADIIRANHDLIQPGMSGEPLWVAQYWSKIHGEKVNYFPNRNGLEPWGDWNFWQWTEGNSPNLSTHIAASYGKGKQAINPDESLYNGLPTELTAFLKTTSYQCPS